MAKMPPDQASALFDYESDTGLLRWKISPSPKIKAGAIAGTKTKRGYIRVMYEQQSYMAHLLIWAIAHGEWPAHEVDHRDRVRDHNRLDNLRPASEWLNALNKSVGKSNTSGVKNVSFHRRTGKWWARIAVGNRKRKSLGLFDTVEAAAAAYRAAETIHHGQWGIYQ